MTRALYKTEDDILWGSLDIACLDLKSDLEETVDCNCETGRTSVLFNLLKPTGHVMHQQFNIQQIYALPTLYLCVLYLSENKQRLVQLTA